MPFAGVLLMVTQFVRGVRGKMNGHARQVVGGISLVAIVTALFSLLAHGWYDRTTYAGDRVPVIDRWMLDHQTWSETAYREVVDANKRTGREVEIGLADASADRVVIRQSIEREADNQFEWRGEQRSVNLRMMNYMEKLDAKIDVVIRNQKANP